MSATNSTPLRVLLVGGSPGLRGRTVARLLAGWPSVVVVGEDADEDGARRTLERGGVDVVVIDANTPGLEPATIRALRGLAPSVVVGPEIGGGREHDIRKPRGGDPDELGHFGRHLVDAIGRAALRGTSPTVHDAPPVATPSASTSSSTSLPRPFVLDPGVGAVVIAASTGGPDALTTVFASLPKELAAPVFIVQHMPPRFADILAGRLRGVSGLEVGVASNDAVVAPGTAWIAPGDHHLELVRHDDRGEVAMRLTRGAPENGCRPAADVLFRTAASVYRRRLLGVVLTGMGCDGAAGCVAVREAGGVAWAQDEPSSTVWGMPGAAVKTGVVSRVLPLEAIGAELLRRVGVRGRRSA